MISIVVPTLNGGQFLAQALTSALAQDADLEVIVQDGGSTDGTVELVESFEDERITLNGGRDNGQADAINRAVAASRGDWILWLNADDLIVEGALGALSTELTPHADVIYGDALLLDVRGNVLRRYRAPKTLTREYVLTRGTAIFSGSMLVRRDRFIAWGGLDSSLSCCMDFEFLARIADSADLKHVPVVIGALRVHESSKSAVEPWSFFREHRAVRRRYARPAASVVTDALRDARFAADIVSSPLRYSRAWSKLRKVKQR